MESLVDKVRRLRASFLSGVMTEDEAVAALTEDGDFTKVGAKDVLHTPSEITSAQFSAAFRRDNSEYQRLWMVKKCLRRGMDS